MFFATLGGVVLVYLVIDFADRAHTYTGRAWGRAAAELYANKAAVVAYQLAPVALIIAAALLMTLLSRHGELTALFALGVRPLRLAAPIAAFAAVLGVALVWLGERVVVGADARAEEIQVTRFNRWGDWATYHAGSSWVRGKFGRIYHLGPQRDGGWEPATVLEIAQPFRLSRRIDARCSTRSRPATSCTADRAAPFSSAVWKCSSSCFRKALPICCCAAAAPASFPGGSSGSRCACARRPASPPANTRLPSPSG